jgi:hypothetical protein
MATTAQQVSKMEALRMRLVELFWVAVIYLSSELAIWGLSCALSPANMEYFSSLFGMLIVFAVVTIAYLGCRRCDAFYHTHIKWKVSLSLDKACASVCFAHEYTPRSTSSTQTSVSHSRFRWSCLIRMSSSMEPRSAVSLPRFVSPTAGGSHVVNQMLTCLL